MICVQLLVDIEPRFLGWGLGFNTIHKGATVCGIDWSKARALIQQGAAIEALP